MVAPVIGICPSIRPTFPSVPGAPGLGPAQRRDLSVAVLSGQRPVVDLAREHGVSRPFCYRQAAKAQAALDDAFDPQADDSAVLYYLPVTRQWIRQFVLGLTLEGHSTERGVINLAGSLLDYHRLSLGTVHNILFDAAQKAVAINRGEDLSGIRVGALDEIYQAGKPVLAGVDVRSTYCFLLSLEESCDATTWGVRMLELSEGGKLKLERSIADGGLGLRRGQKEAWPTVPCLGDVFHPLHEMEQLSSWLARRAVAAREAEADLAYKRRANWEPGKAATLGQRWGMARREAARAETLAADFGLLVRWMRQDVLGVAGEPLQGRRELYDFILAELQAREPLCRQLGGLRRSLAGQREQLLAFAAVQETELADLAQHLAVPEHLIQEVVRLEALDQNRCLYWQRRGQLMHQLGERWGVVEGAVKSILADTHRASSLVENLNGRLRCCFFLRRQLSQPYLGLLRFYLNHHRFDRSQRPERTGKSPWELLSGQEQPHWMEQLGYQLFQRN